MLMYWSFFSSLFFLPVGACLYIHPTFPKVVAVLILAVGIISSFHHTRTYDEDFKDPIQMLDLTLVGLLGASLFYYFHTHFLYWIFSVGAGFIKYKLCSFDQCEEQSLWHAFFHLFCAMGVLCLGVVTP